ncbi:MAG: NAD-dependent epimerase/dehydratase family protein involved in polysaccharide biosynthesis [Mucilaginibacter sp.]|nr:NAD-dependent epimerase/dehydratase family protein involved in polysaccharide biosynthesis [Mucilaginibacter sp.]
MTSYHGDKDLSKLKFLVTGGAGFIGSSLVEYLLKHGAGKVVVLDNFSTGFMHNIEPFLKNDHFELIDGDIRSKEDCEKAVKGIDYILHQAALGSVPRSINDPFTTNEVNITGFLNILIAARDANVKRTVYAASSSTYGDSKQLPKVEENIGMPLSPYAVTKYVNELYANVFGSLYQMQLIGLRYFNVFGPRQAPNGAYAAVIPKFINTLINLQSPVINGDGSISRDFTYIENVIQVNIKSLFTENQNAINQVFNVAYGERTNLTQLVSYLKDYLSEINPDISKIEILYGPNRQGDVEHSLASIYKAKSLLGYRPGFSIQEGLKNTVAWYAGANQTVDIP